MDAATGAIACTMSALPTPSPAIDLLAQFVARIRPTLTDRSVPIKARIRLFWSAAKAASSCGASDVVTEEFAALADITGLTADLGRHGSEDVEHVLRWAWRGRNPFETGRPIL